MPTPNIILITCHDLGDWLPCYGTPAAAPNLDRMAAEGVVFDNHFSTDTVCSPARGSILTGCYPHTHGLMGLVHRGWELNVKRCPPLPAILARGGYETHLFGLQHEHWDWRQLGYGEHHAGKSTHTEDVFPVLNDWLRGRRPETKPFLAAVGCSETHRLGGTPTHFNRSVYEPADANAVRVPPYLPDLPEVREDLRWFYGAVGLVDKMVGTLLETLDQTGLGRETLLLFTTDHGTSFMHAKATLYDGGTKVALLARWPGVLPAGRRVEALTSHVDILPSLLEWTGATASHPVQGRSFAAIAQGRAVPGRLYVFAEKNYTNYYDPSRMIRSHDFKYIRKGLRTCIFDFQIPEIEGMSWGFRQNRACFEFYSAQRCHEEFYDLRADPSEMNNVAENPAYAARLAEMRAALDAHLEATGDPFRHLRNDLEMSATVYEDVRAKWQP